MKRTFTSKAPLVTAMLLSGALNTIDFSFQNKQFVYEGPYYKQFYHPYIQTAMRFLSQFFVLLFYFAIKKAYPHQIQSTRQQAQSSGKILQINKLLLIIPAVLDFITSLLHYISLNFIPGSVYQMLRGGTVLTTFLFSTVILKSKFTRTKLMGAMVVLIGLTIVGLSNYIFSNEQNSSQNTVIGYVLILGSLFTNGLLFVYQEKLLKTYYIEPLFLVGLEGAFGILLSLLIIPIVSIIPCNFNKQACVFNSIGRSYLEQPTTYIAEAFNHPLILTTIILELFFMAIFTSTGVTVTKQMNSLGRSICDVSRTLIVWIVGILLTISLGKQNPSYKWQTIELTSLIMEMIGFAVLVFGNLIYYEIVHWPNQKPPQLLMLVSDDISNEQINSEEQQQ